jgi:RecJ-like exonuclease
MERSRTVEEGEAMVRGFLRRLFASAEELDAEELQRDSAESGSTPACDVQRGELVTITGRLRTVVYTPRTTLPTLEADLYDGSDMVRLVWLGRRHIAGIEPGRAVRVHGRIAVRDGRKVIYNPHYELEAPR